MTETILLFFLLPVEQELIPVRAVAQALVHARDGRGRDADLLRDLGKGLPVGKEGSDLKALGHGLDLAEGAKIVEETVALFFIFQRQDRLEQMIGLLALHFALVHPMFLLNDLLRSIRAARFEPQRPYERRLPGKLRHTGPNESRVPDSL